MKSQSQLFFPRLLDSARSSKRSANRSSTPHTPQPSQFKEPGDPMKDTALGMAEMSLGTIWTCNDQHDLGEIFPLR
jgi:hypothetical protein